MQKIQLAYYGDDFTGSTDALEFISNAGATAMLFIDPPDREVLAKYPGLDVYGVAGVTRALPANEIEMVMTDAFQKMKASGAAHIHYKVCSTFDSSREIGSIGKVIDVAFEVFGNAFVPVLGGAPALGRYCVFGNLFARMGIGSNGEIYRLDRHPSMSRHPVTPANESDLRIHLGAQTEKKIALVDFIQQNSAIEDWKNELDEEKIVLLDAIKDEQLIKIGEWLHYLAASQGPLFTVGPFSVEMALGNYWNKTGLLEPKSDRNRVAPTDRMLVISGSCSPVTAAQIEFARANGFSEITFDPVAVCNNEVDRDVERNIEALVGAHKNVIIHTGSKSGENLPSEKLGTYLGELVSKMVSKHSLKRIGVAGGDTSSYAARAMDIDAVEMIASSDVGAPLCKIFSKNEKMDGLEICFKGGQVGAEDFFEKLLKGSFN